MNYSLNWLNSHIDLSSKSIQEISDLLTFAGIEVEGIIEKGITHDLVVVAQILSFCQHPSADKLSVCQVDDGSSSPRQIVCGAKNFKAGDKVPLALPGAVLPGGFEIKEGKLRGEASLGMMCSGKELGCDDGIDGLMILSSELKTGTPIRQILANDVVLELEITPNRPDLLSHFGLARELSALLQQPLKNDSLFSLSTPKGKSALSSIPVSDHFSLAPDSSCSHYTATHFKNISVQPSPTWLKQRLESIGQRSINNVVDITNFVLHEIGHPIHAFDAAKLSGPLQIRLARADEQWIALDDRTHSLLPNDTVIADDHSPLALAGVMGGKDSGVSSSSSTLWLEAAYFNPSATRKTAFQHNIHSDSSYRFERGADPAQVLQAQALATALLIEFAGATPTQIIQANRQIDTIHLAELNHAQALTTLNIPDTTTADLHRILTHLNLVLKNQDALTSLWEIPSYRADLRRHADLVEEIARIYGLDAVAPSFISTYSPTSSADAIYDEQLRLRQQLAHLGLFESQNLRFVANDALNFSIEHDQPTDKAVPLKNPLSTDYAYLRPNLIAGLLANAEANVRQGTHQLRFFELGTVFETFKAGYMGNDRLSLLLSGANQTQTWQNNKPNNTSIHDLHGILCQSLRISELEWHPLPHTPFFIQRFQLKYQNKAIGWAGQIHPSQARSRDIKNPIFVAEIRYTPLQQALATPPIKYTELPKFPSVSRDVAFELPQSLTYREVRSFFTKYKEPLLVHTELFDLYTDPTGEKLALDKKSMAWQLTYRSLEKTLDSAEVDAAHQKLLTQLKATLNITIR